MTLCVYIERTFPNHSFQSKASTWNGMGDILTTKKISLEIHFIFFINLRNPHCPLRIPACAGHNTSGQDGRWLGQAWFMDRGGSVAYLLLILGLLQQNVLRTCLVPGVRNARGAMVPWIDAHALCRCWTLRTCQ